MMTQTFEIKIALLGYVSVGKTTVLNALFKDKYGEVSKRRTTAGINFFRISSRQEPHSSSEDASSGGSVEGNKGAWNPDPNEPRDASSILKEIVEDNASLRSSNMIQEKRFSIEIDEPLCKMRNDTSLVFVDIPGINEAGSGNIYKDYVVRNWDTFDCVIVVMDANSGVNTEEHIQLLKLIKEQRSKSVKGNIPVIILGNKVDDPHHDPEQEHLLGEIRESIQNIYGVDCRETALQRIVESSKECNGHSCQDFPVFIPISAMNAFSYRAASKMNFEDFCRLDRQFIEKLGVDEIGRNKWRKLSKAKQYEVAFGPIRDPKEYQERLEETNFDKLLSALSYCLGGDQVQHDIIQQQIAHALTLLSCDNFIADQLIFVHQRRKAIGAATDDLERSFWRTYQTCKDSAIQAFRNEMELVRLSMLMGQLERFLEVADGLGVTAAGRSEIKDEMVNLLKQQLGIILEKESHWRIDCSAVLSGTRNISWGTLSPHDWVTIFGSILILRYNKHFCESFGRELIQLETLLSKYHGLVNPVLSLPGDTGGSSGNYKRCSKCGNDSFGRCQKPKCNTPHLLCTVVQNAVQGRYKNGTFEPSNKDKYETAVQIEIPELLSDPKHWGHLAWKLCYFLRDRGTTERSTSSECARVDVA